MIVPPSCISATLKDPSAQTVEGMMSASLCRPCHFSRIPPLVKRKLEMLEDQRVLPPPKISLSRKWQPPPFLKKEAKQSESTGFERAKPATLNTGLVSLPTESLKKSSEAPRILEDCIDQPALKQNQRPCKRKRATAACKAAPSSCVLQSRQSPQTFVSDQALKRTRTLHEDTDGGKTQNQTKASYSSAFLTSHPRVKDCALLNKDEQNEMLQRAKGTKAVMLTMVYRDGSSLLDPEQVSYSCSTACVLHSVVMSFPLKQESKFCSRVEVLLVRKCRKFSFSLCLILVTGFFRSSLQQHAVSSC